MASFPINNLVLLAAESRLVAICTSKLGAEHTANKAIRERRHVVEAAGEKQADKITSSAVVYGGYLG